MTIPELRQRLNLTQGEFASLLGVHSMTVSKWEREVLAPSEYENSMMNEFENAIHSGFQKNISKMLFTDGVMSTVYFLFRMSRGCECPG